MEIGLVRTGMRTGASGMIEMKTGAREARISAAAGIRDRMRTGAETAILETRAAMRGHRLAIAAAGIRKSFPFRRRRRK